MFVMLLVEQFCEEDDFFLFSFLELRVIRDCREAAEWLLESRHRFWAQVEVPDVLQMRENEVAEAARLDDRLWNEMKIKAVDLDETESINQVHSHSTEDMWVFLEETTHFLTYCECQTKNRPWTQVVRDRTSLKPFRPPLSVDIFLWCKNM